MYIMFTQHIHAFLLHRKVHLCVCIWVLTLIMSPWKKYLIFLCLILSWWKEAGIHNVFYICIVCLQVQGLKKKKKFSELLLCVFLAQQGSSAHWFELVMLVAVRTELPKNKRVMSLFLKYSWIQWIITRTKLIISFYICMYICKRYICTLNFLLKLLFHNICLLHTDIHFMFEDILNINKHYFFVPSVSEGKVVAMCFIHINKGYIKRDMKAPKLSKPAFPLIK